MKVVAVLFSIFVIGIVVQANRGQLPSLLAWYQEMPFADTLGHFFLIGLLAFFINMAMGARKMPILGRSFLKGSVFLTAVVVLEECSQIYISTRSFSLVDLSADLLGIALAGFAARRLSRVEISGSSSREGAAT